MQEVHIHFNLADVKSNFPVAEINPISYADLFL